jgi:hypothetical protein
MREPSTLSASRVIGFDWLDDARVRRLADDRLELIWHGPPRIVLGVFRDWAAIDRYVEREAARVEARP